MTRIRPKARLRLHLNRARKPPHRHYRWHAEQLHDYVLFMANTGLRPDEARNLQLRTTVQGLLGEALNDLFQKHGKPEIASPGDSR